MGKIIFQWGVKLPGAKHSNDIEKIDASSALEGYMTPLEYAKARAKATGGWVVKRQIELVKSDWIEQ